MSSPHRPFLLQSNSRGSSTIRSLKPDNVPQTPGPPAYPGFRLSRGALDPEAERATSAPSTTTAMPVAGWRSRWAAFRDRYPPKYIALSMLLIVVFLALIVVAVVLMKEYNKNPAGKARKAVVF
ncbi:hypothetical protein DFP72DRAFT_1169483 [Ephemerocybe angulata]|uniref:Uncharacterized protein n=1 Tax=Ephemerocybe angulata TaxID=980116 RepID=A0A8H6HZ74_9AGAR|nr:hypothetical protein DFP72DRAFT_1169483 [Tulosesus angulatus]